MNVIAPTIRTNAKMFPDTSPALIDIRFVISTGCAILDVKPLMKYAMPSNGNTKVTPKYRNVVTFFLCGNSKSGLSRTPNRCPRCFESLVMIKVNAPKTKTIETIPIKPTQLELAIVCPATVGSILIVRAFHKLSTVATADTDRISIAPAIASLIAARPSWLRESINLS